MLKRRKFGAIWKTNIKLPKYLIEFLIQYEIVKFGFDMFGRGRIGRRRLL